MALRWATGCSSTSVLPCPKWTNGRPGLRWNCSKPSARPTATRSLRSANRPGRTRRPTMRFVDEFRDRGLARDLAAEIARLADPHRHYRFMEVCGGHTHTIYKHGIEDYLPPNITLVHGPGCPVCVIPMGRVDDAMHIARQPGVILTCFGDMMRVPGGNGSFLDASAAGADIRMVYSPLD